MNPVKVLFLSPFFYPETISTGKYNTVLVQALIDRGAAVDVVVSHPFYPTWEPKRSLAELHGAKIHRGGAWVRYPSSVLLRRLVFELWFTCHAARECWALRGDVAVAIAVFPPTLFFILVNYLLPRRTRRIGIVHDLQGILGLHGKGLLNLLLRRCVHAVEKKSFRSCDRLIFLSNSMARTAIAEFDLDPDKVSVCYPFVTVRAGSGGSNRLAHLFPEHFQHVVYSGALGKKQNPLGLLKFYRAAASQLPDVYFHFFSEGPASEELCRLHNADPVDRIRFHKLVSENDLEELYSRSTVQIIPLLDGSADACMPSKLPNILATGCAVLAICDSDSEIAHILRQTNTGVAAGSWNVPVLVTQLEEVLRRAKSQSRVQRKALTDRLLSSSFSLDSLVDAVFECVGGCGTERDTLLPRASKVAGTDEVTLERGDQRL